ncbi:MAG: efflux RND transporter periplasmic adaptor subunit [Patescibacteria group bacterium]|jgi:HlyD family secretion protein
MTKITNFIKTHKKYLVIAAVVLATAGYFGRRIFAQQNTKPIYQTEIAQKGTLISAITASGTISAASNNDISTKAGGVVKEVFVKNGEVVKKGQKIASVTLDDEAQIRATVAYASYIDAVNAEKTAQKNKVTTDIQMWKDRQAYLDAQEDYDYKNNNSINPDTDEDYTDNEKAIIDKTVDQTRLAFEASETAYKNSDAQISKAKALVFQAWQNYQKASSTIVAPVDGVVSNFTLAPGVTIVASADTSSSAAAGSVSSQKLGSIVNPNSQYQAIVNLTEIDVIKVNPDQKVTLTLDAYPDMSFTGKVLSIDTSGKVSSGVTSYPATILIDPTEVKFYPNMAVSANIITNVKNDVILVSSSALQAEGGQLTVRIMRDNEPTSVVVETGDSNDTQTEIVSGLSVGDVVVTSVTTPSTTSSRSSSQGSSVFGGLGGAGRSFGGSGNVRIMTR